MLNYVIFKMITRLTFSVTNIVKYIYGFGGDT